MLLLLAAALADPAAATPVDRMIVLYDELCLQTFPIDGQLDALMVRKGAKPMSAEDVKVTLVDDPGRGWVIEDGDRPITVFLELPPYHACSVRRIVPGGAIDLTAYRRVADAFAAEHRGFTPMKPYDADAGDLHIHAVGEQRDLPSGGGESLMVVDQHVTDPARRAKGETATSLRFVHQIRGEP